MALAILALLVFFLSYVILPPYPFWTLVIAQGIIAAFLSFKFGLPNWWSIIHLSFPIFLYIGLGLDLNPLIYLSIFLLILVFFSNIFIDRVPLYLTNKTTREALKELVKEKKHQRFLDLGSGFGGNVMFMSQLENVSNSVGVETAPFPYIFSKLMSKLRGGNIRGQNLWKTDLSQFDLVYAFLSTEPMPRLWEKAIEQMSLDSLFVSNSFPVPDVDPSEIWELPDKRKTRLYIYNMSEFKKEPQ